MKKGLPITTPKVQPLLLPVLRALADGTDHLAGEIRTYVSHELNLDPDYVEGTKAKNGYSFYENHVAWTFVYLTMGQAIAKRQEGVYQIADRGRAILDSGVSDLTINEAKNPYVY